MRRHAHARGLRAHSAGFAAELAGAGIASFANTVTPQEYARLSPTLASTPNMRLGLGLHPWWIGTPELGSLDDALAAFERELATTRFVGEVGLDFWPSRVHTKDEQLEAFTSIAQLCATKGDVLVSQHSVKAERELLDVLEASGCLERCTCILHSYGGPSDQLTRAVEYGCLFSIGRRMLASKRGREYARILPDDRLLIESDLPASQGAPISAEDLATELAWVIDELARIRGVGAESLREAINARGKALLGLQAA
ncbi:MAG: TatD family hydrolase [Coriobacteriales bacterium]